MKNKNIILASASPRRKELLKTIVRKFKVIPSNINEKTISAKSPRDAAKKTAIAKAWGVAAKQKNSVVIGADTIVVLGRKILGKPTSKKDAVDMLKSLSGKKHMVMTGLAVINTDTGKMLTHVEITEIKMKKLKVRDILDYVNTGSPLDKAGGYGVQEIADPFIEKIDGDYYNVVGLPVFILKKMLDNI